MWKVGYSVALLYLAAAAWQDLRFRQVSVALAVLGAAAAVIFGACSKKEIEMSYLLGALPGIGLLAAGMITGQAIGYGDGLTLTVFGLWTGAGTAAAVLMTALAMTCPVSLYQLAVKKAGRKKEIPFVPFLLAAYLLWLLLEGLPGTGGG